jgi:hypothetical protein
VSWLFPFVIFQLTFRMFEFIHFSFGWTHLHTLKREEKKNILHVWFSLRLHFSIAYIYYILDYKDLFIVLITIGLAKVLQLTNGMPSPTVFLYFLFFENIPLVSPHFVPFFLNNYNFKSQVGHTLFGCLSICCFLKIVSISSPFSCFLFKFCLNQII